MIDPLDKLHQLAAGERKYGIRAQVKVREFPVRTKGAWGVYLHLLVRGRWIKLRRLTHEELGSIGLRPTCEHGYDGRVKTRLGVGPREAAEEAARRISEATGLQLIEP